MLLLQNIVQNYVSIWHWRPSPSITLCKAMVGCKQTIPSLRKVGHGHADWTGRHRITALMSHALLISLYEISTVHQISYYGIGGMILFFVDTLEVHSCSRGPWLVAQERQILEKVLLSPPFLLSRDPPLCSCLGQKGAGDKSWRGSWTKRCNCSLWQQTINCPTSPPENWWQILCWVIVVHETWVLVLGGSHSKKCISELGGNQFETKEIKRQSS